MMLKVFKIILTGLFILTIWQFEIFPTQDGPSHIMNAFILSNYEKFKNFFELNNLLWFYVFNNKGFSSLFSR